MAARPIRNPFQPAVETLEGRNPASSLQLLGSVLDITGTAGNDRISVLHDAKGNLVVEDSGRVIGTYANSQVTQISINTGAGNDVVTIAKNVVQAASITGTTGTKLYEAGGGPTDIVGGSGVDKLVGGTAASVFQSGTGQNLIVGGTGINTVDAIPGQSQVQNVAPGDTVAAKSTDSVITNYPSNTISSRAATTVLSTSDVSSLIQSASKATASNDAIIAVVDRNGRILGVRVEAGVSTAITDNITNLTFAIDGAVAKARTAAFFSNDQAPLTSRTVGFISQSTVTQREVEGNPDITDQNSVDYGPGYVAPVRTGGHFPPGIADTSEVDLFGIEHTNRDTGLDVGTFNVNGVQTSGGRFNVDPNYETQNRALDLTTPVSWGVATGKDMNGQGRGIATLPGGVPIYKNYGDPNQNELVGGIGVFFPGTTGYADAENSSLSATYNPSLPDRSVEAEYIATEAALSAEPGILSPLPVAATPQNIATTEITLGGITLDVFGTGGPSGLQRLLDYGKTLGTGTGAGTDEPVDTKGDTDLAGIPVASGWLVTPHNGQGITAAQETAIVDAGIAQANQTRAAIRLPLGSTTKMVFAVTDTTGAVVALYRMPDATVFSIDVAVAKARNVAYYDSDQLQPQDELPGIPKGVDFTNRTFRYLALPRYPSAADGTPPGYFSILNDPGIDPNTGLDVGPKLPASDYTSVLGYDSFHPGTNFRQKADPQNQNGIVFFPGSSALYTASASGQATLVGGFGVSGDGVDQDDVITVAGTAAMPTPASVVTADEEVFRGIRLPYHNFDRNPDGT